MDFNACLIEAIREYTPLYKLNSVNLEERRECWKQLAEKLQVQEQYLRIRWHSLVQRYQRDINFKYRDQMKFLLGGPNGVPQNVPAITATATTTPEFTINEKDLNDNTKNNVEYTFFEITDPKYNNDNQGSPTKPDKSDCINGKKNNGDIVKSPLMTRKRKAEDENCKAKLNKTSHIQSNTLVDRSINKPVINYSSNQIQNVAYNNHDRSEDVIFGELVTAMLKRMDDEKKRNVKKEIMNLLLT